MPLKQASRMERNLMDTLPDERQRFEAWYGSLFDARWEAWQAALATPANSQNQESQEHLAKRLSDAPACLPPAAVIAAVERMCKPLDESRLSGATAKEDARCMRLIRDYVLEKADAPSNAPLASWDEKALEVARRILGESTPIYSQALARVQCHVVDAMRWVDPSRHDQV